MDFGSPELVSLSEGQVRVASIPRSQNVVFAELTFRNKEELDRFKIDVKDLKVLDTLGIYFDDVPVGQITVWKVLSSDSISLSYWVDKDFYRRGIASSAIRLVASDVFGRYGVGSVFIHISEDNEPSIRLASKLGFVSQYRQVFDTKFGRKLHYVFEWKGGLNA
jgi:RimJ/RimL family protein N-acetyltransferase